MNNKIKDKIKKAHTYYVCDDIINIINFNLNKIKIYEKSYKNILIYYIGYVTIKDSKYVKVNSINPLYINKNKYSKLLPTNKSKEKI